MEVNHLDPSLGTFYVGNLIDDAALAGESRHGGIRHCGCQHSGRRHYSDGTGDSGTLETRRLFYYLGIIDFKENAVKEAIEAAGLTVVEINHQGEWVNITARKPE